MCLRRRRKRWESVFSLACGKARKRHRPGAKLDDLYSNIAARQLGLKLKLVLQRLHDLRWRNALAASGTEQRLQLSPEIAAKRRSPHVRKVGGAHVRMADRAFVRKDAMSALPTERDGELRTALIAL